MTSKWDVAAKGSLLVSALETRDQPPNFRRKGPPLGFVTKPEHWNMARHAGVCGSGKTCGGRTPLEISAIGYGSLVRILISSSQASRSREPAA